MSADTEPTPVSLRESEPAVPRNAHGSQAGLANAEPEVDISKVDDVWKIVFKVHWITFAVWFASLALFNVYKLSKTCRRKRMMNRGYISIVQILIIVLSLTRTLAFCFSPYGLTNNITNLHPLVPRLLFAMGFPCLVAGFTFIHKIFVKISKIEVFSSSHSVLKKRCIVFVLIIHFFTVLTSEVITSYVHGTQILLIICGFYYFIGCLGISLCLCFSGRQVIDSTRRVQQNLTQFQLREIGKTVAVPSGNIKHAASKVINITATTVVFGFFSSLLYVYSLVWMLRKVCGDNSTPSPWIWLPVNTLVRVCELCLAITMSYSVCHSYRR